ncbi:N-acetyltransferase [Fulvimarina sp. 2208YS6-2-32]|uniref:N-acetyltransferase n=1 Tax=Fulvimarina uroteuthidis TaxID=3098149 RepID=A0ABU5I4V4_9HYPH|nr:N-acetyltransferase [Fulvimarina sp. 2208YS6-2-32]MDY8109191.1 N-acetyltransferase [Fulvimarina sp. 2208YS6-2-32]
MSPFSKPVEHQCAVFVTAGPQRPVPMSDVVYRPEAPRDGAAIEAIAREAFGPGRYARAAERVRELHAACATLCFVAELGGEIVGSVRLSALRNRDERAVMLGPLAVRPHLKGRGIGKALLRLAADAARKQAFAAIYLVGDSPYYGLLGYRVAAPGRISLPRPVDPSRVLVLEL